MGWKDYVGIKDFSDVTLLCVDICMFLFSPTRERVLSCLPVFVH